VGNNRIGKAQSRARLQAILADNIETLDEHRKLKA
jgi:hypothetical protein